MRDKGLPVILISHNMPHVFEIADRIHIARLGKRAAVVNPKKISMSDTVAVMTGAMAASDLPTASPDYVAMLKNIDPLLTPTCSRCWPRWATTTLSCWPTPTSPP